tara:strand:- start:768 stop:1325 length:558 start_codon:yes stop_codon:yes gene_type:complete
MSNINKKFINLCADRSVFSLVPFSEKKFFEYDYKDPLDFFIFFWSQYEKFKLKYKRENTHEINNSYNGSALEIILAFLFTRENIIIEKMDEEIDIQYVKPDFLLNSKSNKKIFISAKVSIRERWKQADWEALKYKEKYNNSMCILLMNNEKEYQSILNKLKFLSIDKVVLANSDDINKLIELIKK